VVDHVSQGLAQTGLSDAAHPGKPDHGTFPPRSFDSLLPFLARNHMHMRWHIVLLNASRFAEGPACNEAESRDRGGPGWMSRAASLLVSQTGPKRS
jgi:hypothetical protein